MLHWFRSPSRVLSGGSVSPRLPRASAAASIRQLNVFVVLRVRGFAAPTLAGCSLLACGAQLEENRVAASAWLLGE